MYSFKATCKMRKQSIAITEKVNDTTERENGDHYSEAPK